MKGPCRAIFYKGSLEISLGDSYWGPWRSRRVPWALVQLDNDLISGPTWLEGLENAKYRKTQNLKNHERATQKLKLLSKFVAWVKVKGHFGPKRYIRCNILLWSSAFGPMGYSRNYGLWSELWGTVGTMGYNRNYGYCVLVLSNVCHISALGVPCWPVIVSIGKLG